MRELFLAADPVPVGVRIGDLVHGVRLLASDTFIAMRQLEQVVAASGATLDNVAQVSFFLKDRADMPTINPAWLAVFPNEQDRPTYKFMTADIPDPARVQLEFWAVAGHRRRLLHLPNVAHTNPIPMAIRIGNYVFTSRVLPYDGVTGQPPASVEDQADCLFANIRALLEMADLAPHHITQGRAFVFDSADLPLLQQHWSDLIGSAPAVLQVTPYALAPSLRLMLELIAAS
jgi:2-iminobutanoate/2-iminopropanoate deaminase